MSRTSLRYVAAPAFCVMSLKDRIDTLKAKLNPRRKAGGAR